jgi:hypothetical protein
MSISYNSSIVTNGLVLCVDAGNPRSYSGSGTQWNDATSSGFNFSLTNGPVYSSSNLGSFTFDGVNDFASASDNTALNTQTPTVEVWVKTNATTQNGFWFEKGSVNTQYALFQEGGSITWRLTTNVGSLTATTASFMSTSNWAQVVGTYTSGDRRIYVNGVQVASDALAYTIPTNSSGMFIGAYGTGTGYFYNGALSICRVYNRVLSSAEVLQNFNAIRGRYGI